ncbi:hypothetical protein RRG08_048490 [Elysia crispata]|uniref:Uncharacterized protein n=1 Tax=Elysia crispata TaxID=231223 RepID=A0AAE0YSM1_9GAST|nr:hypothetical protein RRG08_048490 [Elysia crispata]
MICQRTKGPVINISREDAIDTRQYLYTDQSHFGAKLIQNTESLASRIMTSDDNRGNRRVSSQIMSINGITTGRENGSGYGIMDNRLEWRVRKHSPTLQYFIITETNARDDLRHFPNPKSQYINGSNCGGRLKSHWPQSLGHTQTH